MTRPATLLFTLLFHLLFPVATLSAQSDTKALADGLMRSVRSFQAEDGSYGDLVTTCRVLDLLGRSPRHYNELDGPFVRRAAESVARAAGDPGFDAWVVLGLAHAITPPLVTARNLARDRLAADASAWDVPGLLALRTHPPGLMPDLPEPGNDDSPARRVLLADAPASVPSPSVAERAAWVAWARAARLRGVRPESWPPLPEEPTSPVASLDELLDRLELVVAVHGLGKRGGESFASAPPPPKHGKPRPAEDAYAAALSFLEQQQEAGTFGLGMPGWDGPEPGVTALCLSAALRASERLGRGRPDWVEAGLDWLGTLQQPDGSIQTYGVAVYTTSVAMEALIEGGRERDAPIVQRALTFLVAAQADEGEGYSPSEDPLYGGVGYGGDERPDLSNTNIAVEAAARAGLARGHSFFQKVIPFLERNQNLAEVASFVRPRAEGGTIVSGNDGGATYMPGNSPAGEDQVGEGVYVARSYGSMTYALTKSFLICGLPPDDARVVAAVRWLVEHFTLETNPGFADPEQAGDGRYYYYLAMARTLRLLADDQLVRRDGSVLPWRRDLAQYLTAEQRTDGSWVNEDSPRWYEGAPTLCTAFALLSLDAADNTGS